MRKLLIGLLMVVTTNLLATPIEEKASPPTFPTEVSQVCEKGISYRIEKSEIHILVEQIFQYHKELNVWHPMKCKEL